MHGLWQQAGATSREPGPAKFKSSTLVGAFSRRVARKASRRKNPQRITKAALRHLEAGTVGSSIGAIEPAEPTSFRRRLRHQLSKLRIGRGRSQRAWYGPTQSQESLLRVIEEQQEAENAAEGGEGGDNTPGGAEEGLVAPHPSSSSSSLMHSIWLPDRDRQRIMAWIPDSDERGEDATGLFASVAIVEAGKSRTGGSNSAVSVGGSRAQDTAESPAGAESRGDDAASLSVGAGSIGNGAAVPAVLPLGTTVV